MSFLAHYMTAGSVQDPWNFDPRTVAYMVPVGKLEL